MCPAAVVSSLALRTVVDGAGVHQPGVHDLATGRTSLVVNWLRALAASEHSACGGPGVGAIGMCFTGGYALAMATDDRLLAPVLSQPSTPFAITKKQKRSIDISRADLDAVKRRCAVDNLTVLGLRFKGDRFVPAERFDFLRAELGDAFVAIELRTSAPTRRRHGAALGAHGTSDRRVRPTDTATRSTRSSTCSAPACSRPGRSLRFAGDRIGSASGG